MRRSTAPSMVSTAKKPKFVTPFKLQSERANTAAGRVATESKSDIMKEVNCL